MMSSLRVQPERCPACLIRAAIACLSLILIAPDALSQSTDPNSPTVLASNEISGQGTSDKTNYYYAFSADPGDVTLTFDVKSDPKATTSVFDYEILDSRSRRLAGGNVDAARGESKQLFQTFTVKGPGTQQLLLKLTVTQYVATYRVQLEGSVVPATGVAVASQGASGIVSQPASAVAPQPAPDAPPPAAAVATQPASAESTEIKLLSFELDAANKVQMLKDIPSSGTLIIEMKDGTTREIPLKDVKTLTVK